MSAAVACGVALDNSSCTVFKGGTGHTVMPTQEFLVLLSKRIQFQIVAFKKLEV